MPKSIYPSIPAPGGTLDSIVPAVTAMRQTLTMMILNAQKPNPNYTPSSAAQVFVTRQDLVDMGLIKGGPPAGIGSPTAAVGLSESIVDRLNTIEARLAKLERG